jgi:hypothetical protein
MSLSAVDRIADAILYEGYVLYPYRSTAVKNRQRWTFGALLPPAYADVSEGTETSFMQTQCLVRGRAAHLDVRIRFLHPLRRVACEIAGTAGGEPIFHPVETLRIDNRLFQTWDESSEREILVPDLCLAERNYRVRSER